MSKNFKNFYWKFEDFELGAMIYGKINIQFDINTRSKIV